MCNTVCALIVTPMETAIFKSVKNQQSEFEKILGGTIKERLYYYPTIGTILRISTTHSDSCILLNINGHEEICDMDIFKAYQVLHTLSYNLPIINEITDTEALYLKGTNVCSKKTITEHTDTNSHQEISFSFYENDLSKSNRDKQLIGNATVYFFENNSIFHKGSDIEDISFKNMKSLSSTLQLFNNRNIRSKSEGIVGKVAVIETLFVDGPFINKGELELASIGNIINYFSNTHKIDFLLINPALLRLNIYQEIIQCTGETNTLCEFKEILMSEFGFSYELSGDYFAVLDMSIHSKAEEDITHKSESNGEAWFVNNVNEKFIQEIMQMENLSLGAKGLLLYFTVSPDWTIQELLLHCLEDYDEIELVLEELEEEVLIYKIEDTYYIREDFIEYLGVQILNEANEEESIELNKEPVQPVLNNQRTKMNEKYGVDFELLPTNDTFNIFPISEVYMNKEEYNNQLRPLIVKNMLMIKGDFLSSTLPYNNTPLMLAAFHDDEILLHSILKNLSIDEIERERNAKNVFGQSVLSIAIRKDLDSIVQLLLNYGFSIDTNISFDENVKGDNLFRFALYYHSYKSFQLLVNHAKEQKLDITNAMKSVLELDAQGIDIVPEGIIDQCYDWFKFKQSIKEKSKLQSGKRYEFLISEVKKENGYYIFNEENGNKLFWKTSSNFNLEDSQESLFKIKATIKKELTREQILVERVKKII